MTNPFNGLVNQTFKNLHRDAIYHILETCSQTCTIVYGDTKFTDCENCIFDVINGRSSNRYQSGGPIPFTNGTTCPYCQGNGRIGTESTESVELGIIWDYKNFMSLGGGGSSFGNNKEQLFNLQSVEGMIQTYSKLDDTLPQLRRAKKLIIAEKETGMRQTFERAGEFQMGGLGDLNFVVGTWRRIK